MICYFSSGYAIRQVVCAFSLVSYLFNQVLILWHLEHEIDGVPCCAHRRHIASVCSSRVLCTIASRYMRLHV